MEVALKSKITVTLKVGTCVKLVMLDFLLVIFNLLFNISESDGRCYITIPSCLGYNLSKCVRCADGWDLSLFILFQKMMFV
jgi:hypothetical protein